MSARTKLDDGVTGDAELIASARSGDAGSVGALYERHAGAAWVVARQYTDSPADADDVVADSFAAVFGAIQRGNGPESAFRAYLFTVVRRVAAVRREKARRVQPTDDVAVLEAGTAWAGTAEEPALAGFERGVVARAFHTLPERWQAVLWHTEVEGLTPAEIAPVLGLTANGVAALAYRAREGLRQAYLQQHLQDPLDEGCRAVAGKLGAYVRGGLGTRETAQVEPHLETCGTCRGLLLELGDVNHGMRSVIAPLVLGLAGVGALAVALPIGGGLAAGAAAAAAGGVGGAAGAGGAGGAGGAAGAGAGGAGAGAAGAGATGAGATAAAAGATGAAVAGGGAAATGGVAGATAVATGAVGVVGVGAAGGAAAAGGVAAFLAAIPLGAAAVAVGGVAIAAAAAISVVTLLGEPEGSTLAAPSPTSSTEASIGEPTPAPTADAAATPRPTDIPTPEPSDLLLDETVLDDEPADDPAPEGGDLTADGPQTPADPADRAPADPSGPSGSGDPAGPSGPADPADPAGPTDPVDPPQTPPDVSVDVPTAGLALEAGLGDQVLSVGVRNSGGTAVTDLVAEVTLPSGVSLDGVADAALAGLAAGRFAVSSAGWVCVTGDGSHLARCTLDSLPAFGTSTLVLRVSIDESFDRSDGEIGLRVVGTGLVYVAPPIHVAIAPSPARLALRSVPASVPLATERTRRVDLPVSNVGGTSIPAREGVVTVLLPDGVTAAAAPGSSWSCVGADALVCRTGQIGARTDAPLSLLLSASADAPRDATLTLQLAPSGRRSFETVTVPVTVQDPAVLAVNGPSTAQVALGSPTTVPLSISNTGGLPASDVKVTLRRPGSLGFGSPAVLDGAWTCSAGDTATVVCTAAQLDAGATLDLPLQVLAVAGQFPAAAPILVSVGALDADAATEPFEVAVDVARPVLGLGGYDPRIELRRDGTGTVRFTVSASEADAASAVATLVLPPQLRAALEDTDPPQQIEGCRVPGNPHTVTCDFGTLAVGAPVQVAVSFRWSGNPKGFVTVVADAVGAAPVHAHRAVQTASVVLTPRTAPAEAQVVSSACGSDAPDCAEAPAGDDSSPASSDRAADRGPSASDAPSTGPAGTNGQGSTNGQGNGPASTNGQGNGSASVADRGDGAPVTSDRGNGQAASNDPGNGPPATSDRGNGPPATNDRGNGPPATNDRGNGPPATNDRGNGPPATNDRGNGPAAVDDRGTGSSGAEGRDSATPVEPGSTDAAASLADATSPDCADSSAVVTGKRGARLWATQACAEPTALAWMSRR